MENENTTNQSSDVLLQSFFDLTNQHKIISAQLEALRPQVIKLLEEQKTKAVNGGIINLKWRKGTASYSPNLFDELSIEQIKLCAKFSAPLIKKQGLLKIASPFIINQPDVPYIYCKLSNAVQ